MKTFQLDIVTPTKVISEGQVEYLRAPSIDGLFGVEAGHAPAVIALGIGEIKVVRGTDIIYYSTSGGYADIRQEEVMLLVETIQSATDIDIEKEKAAIQKAKDMLGGDQFDHVKARRAMEIAKNSIKVSRRTELN
ncbi:MAG: ATP synthase F1 subunit epsilon [Fidelibacterota bacterium]